MRLLKLDSFTINGNDSGTLQSPCDGATAMTIQIQLSGQLANDEAGGTTIPIWIGERHWYGDTTLIQSYVQFTGAPGTRLTASSTFTLTCSPSCDLVSSGPNPRTILVFPSWWFRGGPDWGRALGEAVWWFLAKTFVWFDPTYPDGMFTVYNQGGHRMVLSAGYYDKAEVPLFRWWYGRRTITVECGACANSDGSGAAPPGLAGTGGKG